MKVGEFQGSALLGRGTGSHVIRSNKNCEQRLGMLTSGAE